MTLIHCRACGHKISEAAAACPNCGEPVQGNRTLWEKSETGGKWSCAVGIVLMVADIILGTSLIGGLGLMIFVVGTGLWLVGWLGSREDRAT